MHTSGDVKYLDKGDTDIERPLTIAGVVSLVLSVTLASGSFESHDPLSQGDSMEQANRIIAFCYTTKPKFNIPCSVTSNGISGVTWDSVTSSGVSGVKWPCEESCSVTSSGASGITWEKWAIKESP